MTEEKLLPCPFCGKKQKITYGCATGHKYIIHKNTKCPLSSRSFTYTQWQERHQPKSKE